MKRHKLHGNQIYPIYIEASGVIGSIAHPSTLPQMFRNGLVDFVVQQMTSQINTLIDAAVWFNWWPDRGHGPVVWFAVAYVAYIAGLNLARHETGFGSRVVELDSRERWRSMIRFRRDRTEAVKEESGDQTGRSASDSARDD